MFNINLTTCRSSVWNTKYTPWMACTSIFNSNNLKQVPSVWLSVPCIIGEGFWPSLLYSVASVHWGLLGFVYAQPFKPLAVWTLTGSLQHLDFFFLFQPFGCRFVLGFFVLLHDPIRANFSSWKDGLTFDSRILWCLEDFIFKSDCKLPRSCGCKISWNHHPSITEAWQLVWGICADMLCFMLLHCALWPDISTLVVSVHANSSLYPKITLGFLQFLWALQILMWRLSIVLNVSHL